MQIPVLVEPIENGFRARTGEPLGLVAEGSTEEEAVQRLRQLVRDRLAAGVRLVPLDVGPDEHPWMKFAGTLKDDPMLEDWKRAMAEYRQEVEKGPDIFEP
jgi:hypothetical protein